MIDVLRDKLLSPGELAELIPVVGNQKATAKMVRAWINHGVGGVRLECVKVGRAIATTEQAFREFSRARSGRPAAAGFEPSEADVLADRQLQAMGL